MKGGLEEAIPHPDEGDLRRYVTPALAQAVGHDRLATQQMTTLKVKEKHSGSSINTVGERSLETLITALENSIPE